MRPSYVHGASETPLLGQTIGENLDRAVERLGDREALVSATRTCATRTRSWGRPSTALARALLAAGLEPGDRVGIWSPNCAEWVLVQYATAKAGIVLVNINPAYRTSELEYALRQSGCRRADRRAGVQDLRLRGDDRRRSAATCPSSSGSCCSARRVGGAGRRRRTPDDRAAGRASSTTRSTSSTRAAPRASPRAPRSATTTSSTTATSSARAAATTSRTASASPCPSTTASAWSWATSAAPRTAPAW